MSGQSATSVDPAELAKFEAMAADWWDADGPFRPLHRMNAVRLDYLTRQIAAEHGRDLTRRRPFEGLSILDLGCGGGLVSEPLARLGADVTGVDAGGDNVAVAAAHARAAGLTIDYRPVPAETLVAEGATFDAVVSMEVIEHVADPAAFLTLCHALLRPGAPLVLSTLNRTPTSFAAAIVGAEWLLRWLPRGTHNWGRFVTPAEMETMATAAGLDLIDRTGMIYHPLRDDWRLGDDLSVNYAATAIRRG